MSEFDPAKHVMRLSELGNIVATDRNAPGDNVHIFPGTFTHVQVNEFLSREGGDWVVLFPKGYQQ